MGNYIENLSDQVVGYSEEIANAIEDISKRYDVSKEFALLIVQTAIEDMKMDVEHHKHAQIEIMANAAVDIANSINELSEVLK